MIATAKSKVIENKVSGSVFNLMAGSELKIPLQNWAIIWIQ